MKMAKYIDSQYDRGKMTAAETKRWDIVNSAFRQYSLKDADFEKSACDRALAMSLDEAKKGKDIGAEKKLKDLMYTLKREPRRVEEYREKVPAPKRSL